MSSGNRFPKCFVQTLHDVFSAAHPNFKRVVRSVRRAARRKEAAVHLEPLPLYFPRCMPAAGPAGVRSPAHGPRNGARLDGAPPTAALKDTCVSARATRPGAAGIYPGGSIPEGRAASGGGAQNKRTSLRMSFCSGFGLQSGYFERESSSLVDQLRYRNQRPRIFTGRLFWIFSLLSKEKELFTGLIEI